MTKLKQGSIRTWYPGIPELDGMQVKICGLSTTGQPVIGISYIVELPKKLPSYPYTHAVALEIHLR